MIKYDEKRIREELNSYLKTNNISQRQFAKEAGLNVSIISRVISGAYRPGRKVLEKILTAMHINVVMGDYEAGESLYLGTIDDIENALTKWSIDDLSLLLVRIRHLRDEKICSEKENLERKIERYNQLLEEA